MKDIAFPPMYDRKTKSLMLQDYDGSVRQSIKIIIFTQRGERIGNPSFGTDLARFMFEPIDSFLISDMENELRRSITRYESRIKELDVLVEEGEAFGSLVVTVAYINKEEAREEWFSLDIDLSSGVL
ncbi:MAG: GPW/gp25 family protein [Clostridia bacterium]|nr:GPW/gp25 family protein [Clostridia bacterium]